MLKSLNKMSFKYVPKYFIDDKWTLNSDICVEIYLYFVM